MDEEDIPDLWSSDSGADSDTESTDIETLVTSRYQLSDRVTSDLHRAAQIDFGIVNYIFFVYVIMTFEIESYIEWMQKFKSVDKTKSINP